MPPRVGAGLLLGVISVSWAAIFIRLAHAPALTTAAWRLTLAGIPLVIWVTLRHRRELAGLSRNAWLLLIGSGVALALHFGTSIARSTSPAWRAAWRW